MKNSMHQKAWMSAAALIVMLCLAGTTSAENGLLEELVGTGVRISATQTAKLPPPTLPDGLDAAGQRGRIESLLAGRHAWDAFTRRSVVAPLLLKISDDQGGQQIIGRHVDLWFVAYGDLQSLNNDDFLTRQIRLAGSDPDAENGSRVALLADSDLTKRRLTVPRGASDPRFVFAESNLLDRVRLTVTTRNLKTFTGQSISVASVLDERFASDAEFANTWRLISRDSAGRRQLGAPQPYVGMGSYVKVTRLLEPAGALFVEYHLAFAEPKEWFQGTSLLRSKLPIVAQDAVRRFRRSLEKE